MPVPSFSPFREAFIQQERAIVVHVAFCCEKNAKFALYPGSCMIFCHYRFYEVFLTMIFLTIC